MANKPRKATPARKKKASRTSARPNAALRTDGQLPETPSGEAPYPLSTGAVPASTPSNRGGRTSWPTRRSAVSARTQLPVQDLAHVRTDLVRIALLSASIGAILVILTFFLR
jgi:hypothetical protein